MPLSFTLRWRVRARNRANPDSAPHRLVGLGVGSSGLRGSGLLATDPCKLHDLLYPVFYPSRSHYDSRMLR